MSISTCKSAMTQGENIKEKNTTVLKPQRLICTQLLDAKKIKQN